MICIEKCSFYCKVNSEYLSKVLLCALQDLAHGLGELLSYEGNVEEDFYTTFQVSPL